MKKIYFIDLFCGAGGVTSGIHRARYLGQKFAEVIACVNHDPLAIASHEHNHPDCLHYIEKIQVLDLTDLRGLVIRLRAEDPDCLIFIWASLECTNFSKAKGGLPRDADSRTLAEHMFRYLEELAPDGPAGAITCKDHHSIVSPAFILKYNSTDKNGVHRPPSVNDPAPAVTCQNRLGLVQPAFIAKYYGNGDNISSIESPAGTLTTKDRLTLVQAAWLDKNYSGRHNHQSVDLPAGTVVTNDKHALMTAESSFLLHTNFSNQPTGLFAPAPTVTASRHYPYLVNPSWGGHNGSIDQPSPVIIARQDKAPMYLVQAISGVFSVPVYSEDSPCMVKIKEFMAAFNIVDIKMRMLKIPELLRIQGFGDGYVLKGNQSDQKRFIGNAVEVNQAKVLIEAMYQGLVAFQQRKTA